MHALLTIFFIPTYVTIYKVTNNLNIARLYAHSLLVFYPVKELIDNKMYQFNNLIDYNYTSELSGYIAVQYFIYDSFYIYQQKPYLFHHLLCSFGIMYGIYYNIYHVLFLYLLLGEISTIFLDLCELNICKKINYLLFKINFIVFRLMLLPVLTYKCYNNTLIFIMLSSDCFLHMYWIKKAIC